MDPSAMRERLGRERIELEATVTRLRERLAVSRRDSGGEIALADQHPTDAASETDARELDVPRHGGCVLCGKRILDERLELVPETS